MDFLFLNFFIYYICGISIFMKVNHLYINLCEESEFYVRKKRSTCALILYYT